MSAGMLHKTSNLQWLQKEDGTSSLSADTSGGYRWHPTKNSVQGNNQQKGQKVELERKCHLLWIMKRDVFFEIHAVYKV